MKPIGLDKKQLAAATRTVLLAGGALYAVAIMPPPDIATACTSCHRLTQHSYYCFPDGQLQYCYTTYNPNTGGNGCIAYSNCRV